jgi:hypothetical protein
VGVKGYDLRFEVLGFGFLAFGFKVQGSGFMVYDLGYRA